MLVLCLPKSNPYPAKYKNAETTKIYSEQRPLEAWRLWLVLFAGYFYISYMTLSQDITAAKIDFNTKSLSM
jgi:hypothetical protein